MTVSFYLVYLLTSLSFVLRFLTSLTKRNFYKPDNSLHHFDREHDSAIENYMTLPVASKYNCKSLLSIDAVVTKWTTVDLHDQINSQKLFLQTKCTHYFVVLVNIAGIWGYTHFIELHIRFPRIRSIFHSLRHPTYLCSPVSKILNMILQSHRFFKKRNL